MRGTTAMICRKVPGPVGMKTVINAKKVNINMVYGWENGPVGMKMGRKKKRENISMARGMAAGENGIQMES